MLQNVAENINANARSESLIKEKLYVGTAERFGMAFMATKVSYQTDSESAE